MFHSAQREGLCLGWFHVQYGSACAQWPRERERGGGGERERERGGESGRERERERVRVREREREREREIHTRMHKIINNQGHVSPGSALQCNRSTSCYSGAFSIKV